VEGKNGKVYYNFTIAVNDETNDYGQNVSAFDYQTKEEREAKKPKTYIGNGKVVWTDGQCTKAEWVENHPAAGKETQSPKKEVESDLPF
jgi:hypothetical protein